MHQALLIYPVLCGCFLNDVAGINVSEEVIVFPLLLRFLQAVRVMWIQHKHFFESFDLIFEIHLNAHDHAENARRFPESEGICLFCILLASFERLLFL